MAFQLPALTKWIMDNVTAIMPFTVVHEFQRGVRFGPWVRKGWRWGFDVGVAKRQDLKAGWYFHVPGFQSIDVVDVKQQIVHLWNISMMTSDGEAMAVRSNLGYEIKCAWRMYVTVHDFDTSLKTLAENFLADAVRRHDMFELQAMTDDIESECLRLLRKEARRWGARITHFKITECVPAIHIKDMR